MDRESYLEAVRSLLPALRERAAYTEELRRLPDETLADFKRLGLFRVVQPRRYGGYELDPWTMYEAIALLATACPSSGWVMGVIAVHSWQLALFPIEAQEDVWGKDTGTLISSAYAPTGHVEAVEGGFKLNGRWSFSSGCDHGQWIFLGGAPAGLPPGKGMRTFLLPRSDYTIEDNWHVMGLSGTGSKDILVDNVFVPEYRTHKYSDAYYLNSPGQVHNNGSLYRLPFGCVFRCALPSVAIGAAEGALNAAREKNRSRRSSYENEKVSADPFLQRRLASATSEISAAWAGMRTGWEDLLKRAEAGDDMPIELRAHLCWEATNAVERSVKAVDLLMEAMGGRAIFRDNPVQRAFRDIHAVRAHATNNPDKGAMLFASLELTAEGEEKRPLMNFI